MSHQSANHNKPPAGIMPTRAKAINNQVDHRRAVGLKRLLRNGQPCVLATVDAMGAAYTTFVGWVTAHDDHSVCLALDTRGIALRNLQRTPLAALEILAPDQILGIRGTAGIDHRPIAACPFPSVAVKIDVIEVRDHTGPGIIWQGPKYHYVADKQHRYTVEQAVLNELRVTAVEWTPPKTTPPPRGLNPASTTSR
jgi:hypothetical protein